MLVVIGLRLLRDNIRRKEEQQQCESGSQAQFVEVNCSVHAHDFFLFRNLWLYISAQNRASCSRSTKGALGHSRSRRLCAAHHRLVSNGTRSKLWVKGERNLDGEKPTQNLLSIEITLTVHGTIQQAQCRHLEAGIGSGPGQMNSRISFTFGKRADCQSRYSPCQF